MKTLDPGIVYNIDVSNNIITPMKSTIKYQGVLSSSVVIIVFILIFLLVIAAVATAAMYVKKIGPFAKLLIKV